MRYVPFWASLWADYQIIENHDQRIGTIWITVTADHIRLNEIQIHPDRFDETTESNAIHSPINYHRTKYLAEREIHRGIDMGLDAVMLNPANIIGPCDYRNWSQLFILIDRQKLPGVPGATQTFCHVREVARAHLAAYRGIDRQA